MINLGNYPLWVIILLIVWVLPWKGYSLWTAAHRKEKVWFIILLVLNTVGILEIIYIFFVAKIKPTEMFGKAKAVEGKKEEPKPEETQNGQQQ